MSFRRKDNATRCKQLDLSCSLSQLLARSLAHLIDPVGNHRHNGERAYMTARVDQLIGSPKIGTPARLRQRLSRVKKPWPTNVPSAKSRAIEWSAPPASRMVVKPSIRLFRR